MGLILYLHICPSACTLSKKFYEREGERRRGGVRALLPMCKRATRHTQGAGHLPSAAVFTGGRGVRLLGQGKVDTDRPSIQVLAVTGVPRGASILQGIEVDEGKSTRFPSLSGMLADVWESSDGESEPYLAVHDEVHLSRTPLLEHVLHRTLLRDMVQAEDTKDVGGIGQNVLHDNALGTSTLICKRTMMRVPVCGRADRRSETRRQEYLGGDLSVLVSTLSLKKGWKECSLTSAGRDGRRATGTGGDGRRRRRWAGAVSGIESDASAGTTTPRTGRRRDASSVDAAARRSVGTTRKPGSAGRGRCGDGGGRGRGAAVGPPAVDPSGHES